MKNTILTNTKRFLNVIIMSLIVIFFIEILFWEKRERSHWMRKQFKLFFPDGIRLFEDCQMQMFRGRQLICNLVFIAYQQTLDLRTENNVFMWGWKYDNRDHFGCWTSFGDDLLLGFDKLLEINQKLFW